MAIKLLNNYLLVKKVEEKETDGFKTVSAVNELIGKGQCTSTPTEYDYLLDKTIYFEKSLGTEFEIDGQKVKFIKLEDVMGYE
jgi:co-chaperonin GroES (HSP10)